MFYFVILSLTFAHDSKLILQEENMGNGNNKTKKKHIDVLKIDYPGPIIQYDL